MSPSEPLVAGRFRPDAVLEGGATAIRLGADVLSGRRVVIRTTAAATLPDGHIAQLRHDARILRQRAVPGVAQVLAVGTAEGQAWLVHDFVPGHSLRRRLRAGPIPPMLAVRLAERVLTSLAALQAAGLMHRNVRPTNVILPSDGDPAGAALVDFGLVRLADESDDPVSVRTLRYQAPEQVGLLRTEVDARADLFAVGVLLYEALTGRPPFGGADRGAMLRAQLGRRPQPLRRQGVDVPRAFDALVARLLRRDPRDRYQTAQAALDDLTQIRVALEAGDAEPPVVVGRTDRRDTLTRPDFVGRGAERLAVANALERASRGEPVLVRIEGVSGAGRSRLITELGDAAARWGTLVLRGLGALRAGLPHGGLSAPVAQLAEALEDRPDLAATLRRRLGEAAATVRSVIPSLRGVIPGALPSEGGDEAEVVVRLLCALGDQGQPALLLFDEAERLDEATVAAIRRWQQTDAPRHLAVVLVVDADRVGPANTLPADRVLRLTPLDAGDTAALSESMAGALPEAIRTRVFQLSGGNPFAARAALRGLVESGALVHEGAGWRLADAPPRLPMPSTAPPAAVSARLGRLDPQTLRWLTAGAVLGDVFSERVACQLSGLGGGGADFALLEATRAHIAWHEPPDVRFVHPAMRVALLDRLSATQRGQLHLLAAELLEAAADGPAGPTEPGELARHLAAGGDPEAAAPHALRAAKAAEAHHQLDEAIELYTLAERAPTQLATPDRRSLMASLGRCLMKVGQYEAAKTRMQAVLALAASPPERAAALGELGELAFRRSQPDAAATLLIDALAELGVVVPETGGGRWRMLLKQSSVQLARVVGQPGQGLRGPEAFGTDALVASLLRALSRAWYVGHGPAAALGAHLLKLNMVERYAASAPLAVSYGEHALILSDLLGPGDAALGYANRAVKMATGLGDDAAIGVTRWFRGIVRIDRCEFDDALGDLRAAVTHLLQAGLTWETELARYHLARCRLARGELQAALTDATRLFHEADASARPSVRLRALAVQAAALGGRLAESELRRARGAQVDDPLARAALAAAAARHALAHQRPQRAVAILDEALSRARRAGVLLSNRVRPLAVLRVTALRVRLTDTSAYDRGGRARGLRKLQAGVRQARALASGRPLLQVTLTRERGLVAALSGKPRAARRLLDEALRLAEHHRMPFEQMLSLAAWAEVGVSHGWPGASSRRDEAERQRRRIEPPTPADERAERTASLIDRFSGVLRGGRRLASSLTVPDVHRALRAAVAELLRVEQCLLYAVEPDGLRPLDPPTHDVDGDVLDATLRGLEVVCLDHGDGQGGEPRSIICAPVVVRGQAAALFYCEQPGLLGVFGPEEKRLAEFVAALAGAALENAAGFDAVRTLSRTLDERTRELVQRNVELVGIKEEMEAFSYSVAHDLRGGLMAVNGYATALGEDFEDNLDDMGRHFLDRLQVTATRLGRLTKALMVLSGISRSEMQREPIDVTALVTDIATDLGERVPQPIDWRVPEHMVARGDADLLRIVLENLLGNAAKFTRDRDPAVIEVGRDGDVFFVRDNGAGFDMAYADKLFRPFQRLHEDARFTGTGIGLATVLRAIRRHGGTISATGEPGRGATFRFTLAASSEGLRRPTPPPQTAR